MVYCGSGTETFTQFCKNIFFLILWSTAEAVLRQKFAILFKFWELYRS